MQRITAVPAYSKHLITDCSRGFSSTPFPMLQGALIAQRLQIESLQMVFWAILALSPRLAGWSYGSHCRHTHTSVHAHQAAQHQQTLLFVSPMS